MNSENQLKIARRFGNKSIEVLYSKAQPFSACGTDPIRPHFKLEFKPGSNILRKGTTYIEGGIALPCDIIWERDTGVKMRDGVTLYCDILRPVGGKDLPAIISWSPYGKGIPQPPPMGVAAGAVSGLQRFEGPDPAYWCNHGYAIVNVDARGTYYSEGNLGYWGNPIADDIYDFVEWLAVLDWCNGKTTMSGNSWLAITQWFAAARPSPHLTAIAPWEGHIDLYRYDVLRGGILDTAFNKLDVKCAIGKNWVEDMADMAHRYPLMNAYWEDKGAKLEQITIPAYIVASWGAHHTIDAYRRISSKEKWLRVHNTGEWPDFYEHSDDLRRFYDHYLKGIDNGWEKTPRVRVSVLNPGGEDRVDRPEKDWPLAGTNYKKFHLDAGGGKLTNKPTVKESSVRYQADDGTSSASFTIDIKKDTDFIGYVSLRLWVEAEGASEADIFVVVHKLDANGKLLIGGFGVIGPDGRLRASQRELDTKRSTPYLPIHTHRKEEPLKPGQPVMLDIEVRPIGMHWSAGEKLRLIVGGYNVINSLKTGPSMINLPGPETHNAGYHIIHTGGRYDSYLRMPEVD
jgi:uncharacterized protein